MMRRYLLLAWGLAAFSNASAGSIDFSNYRCSTFLGFISAGMQGKDGVDKMSVAVQMSWIYGWLAGEHHSTIFDPARSRAVLTAIGNTCQAQPASMLLPAMEQAWTETDK